jgi:hypothetical protein
MQAWFDGDNGSRGGGASSASSAEVQWWRGVVDDGEEFTVRLWLRGIGWWCSAAVATAVAALGFRSRAR